MLETTLIFLDLKNVKTLKDIYDLERYDVVCDIVCDILRYDVVCDIACDVAYYLLHIIFLSLIPYPVRWPVSMEERYDVLSC